MKKHRKLEEQARVREEWVSYATLRYATAELWMHFVMHCDDGENENENDCDDHNAYAHPILPEVLMEIWEHTHSTQRSSSQMFSRDRFLTASNSIKNWSRKTENDRRLVFSQFQPILLLFDEPTEM